MAIGITMCKLLITMLIGWYLGKSGVFSPDTNKSLSYTVINFTSPALILYSVTKIGEGKETTVWTLLIMGLCSYLLLPFLGMGLARLLKVEKDLRGMYLMMVLFSNNAFMGFPVVQSLFGNQAVFYTAILHMPFNLLFFTLGLYLIHRDAGEENHFAAKDLLNAGTVASVLSLLVYFMGIKIPQGGIEILGFVGNMTMPLSMLIIGSTMAGYHLKEIFGNRRMYLMSFVRLGILPLMAFLCFRQVTSDPLILQVATVTFGMPVAALVAMGSAPYEKQGEVGAIAVAMTTILSMGTIPIMAALLGVGM